jgi:hypothetical protein
MKLAIGKDLKKSNSISFIIYGMVVAFCTYTCMYAFRKPIMVATFSQQLYFGIDYKVLLITAQIIGYTVSKFIGIKVVSELSGNRRAWGIILLISISGVALVLFALTPAPYNLFFIFINGLPLGMIWGLIFSYLEGRKSTELLGIGLAITQIFSSGLVKTVGKSLLLDWRISEVWMPFLTAIVFLLPLLFFVYLLNQLPPPDYQDIMMRAARKPMNRKERWRFFILFMPGLIFLILTYTFLTVYRDFRDNFSADIWNSLGYSHNSLIFTQTEIPIFLVVMTVVGMMVWINSNYWALLMNHLLVILGVGIVGISTRLFQLGQLSPEVWMIWIGLGLYLAYTTFSLMLFERLMSTFRYVGTVGFIMYLADSCGYLGSVIMLFYKNYVHSHISWLDFFIYLSYWLSSFCIIFMLMSLVYFQVKYYYNFRKNILHKSSITLT